MDDLLDVFTEPFDVVGLDRDRYHQENDDPPEFPYYDMEDDSPPWDEAEWFRPFLLKTLDNNVTTL